MANAKIGWRVPEWCAAVGLKRAYVYLLMDRGKIANVRCGRARIITIAPEDFIASLAAA